LFKLKLFGTPQVEGPRGVVPVPGPRRLAVLASLASAGSAGLTRDKLVARLWPDTDDDRARRNLSQLLYAVRTELGADLIEGSQTIRLDPAQCTSDVGDFDQALAEHRDADAVKLYSGPFLDGFHLSDCAEFSLWADAERARRMALAQAAALRVAEATSPDNPRAAVTAWSAVVALDPLNSALVLRLIAAIEASGDGVAAVRAGEQYASRMRAELETEPDAAVVRRVEAIRQNLSDRTLSPPPVVVPDVPSLRATLHEMPSASPVAPAPRARPFRRWPLAVAAVAGTVAVISVVAWTTRSAAVLRSDEYVMIAEFANKTSDTLLTRSVGAAVSAALQQSARVVPLPRSRMAATLRRMDRADTVERLDLSTSREIAQREGVRFVLGGEVVDVGGALQLISQIVEAQTGRVIATRTFPVKSSSEILGAIDRLAAALRRDLGESASSVDDAVPLPDVTTPSLAALDLYAQAKFASRRLEDGLARDLLYRAVALDSNFAMAQSALGLYWTQNNDIPRATYHFARAMAQRDRLPPDEALRISIVEAYGRGDYDAAVAFSERYLLLRPRDQRAWADLGFYLYMDGRLEEARKAYATAEGLGPLTGNSFLNVAYTWSRSAKNNRDVAAYDSARRYFRRAFALQPGYEYADYTNQLYGATLLALGFTDSARATFDRMTARGQYDRARGMRSNGYLDAMIGNWESASNHFAMAAQLMVNDKQWTSTLRNDALHGEMLVTLGDFAAAAAPLRRATAIALREPIEPRAVKFIALAQAKAGNAAVLPQLLARMRAAARPSFLEEQAAILAVEGALAIAEGRFADAVAKLEAATARDSVTLGTRIWLARARAAAGDLEGALAQWEKIGRSFEFGYEGQFDWQFASYERAVLLERLGRTEQATTAYREFLRQYPESNGREPVALPTARRRLAALERR
jgi:DNA-binding SARP family transcriptional activator/TolB-like protein